MIYKTHYDSPLGGMLLSADEKGLTGVLFDGQKYYARGQADSEPEAGAAICNAPCELMRRAGWTYTLREKSRTSTCRSIRRELIFRKESGGFYA